MNDQVQAGHEHAVSQGSVLQLSQAWLDSVTEEQVSGYVTTLAELSKGEHAWSANELADELRKRVQDLGFELAEPSYQRTAELLAGSERLQICAPDGTVLYSDPGLSTQHPSERDPGVLGTEDPADDERPGFGA